MAVSPAPSWGRAHGVPGRARRPRAGNGLCRYGRYTIPGSGFAGESSWETVTIV